MIYTQDAEETGDYEYRMRYEQMHRDAVQNTATGIGTSGDTRSAGRFTVPNLPKNVLLDMYEGDDLAARIIDIFPDQMTREGFKICVDNNPEISEAINEQLKDLEILNILRECMIKMRLFGGCAILIGANDGTSNLELPLDEENIRSVDYFTVLDRYECMPVELYENPAAPKFRKPKFYRLQPENMVTTSPILQKIHESRLLVMSMPYVSHSRTRGAMDSVGGWGNSALVRIYDRLRDYDQVWGGVSHAMIKFVQTVYGLTDLSNKLEPREAGSGDSEFLRQRKRGLQNRIGQLNYYSSVANAILIDKERETFDKKTTVLSGVPETLDKYMIRVSAAAQLPVTVLFGTSPNGLGATGAADTRFFYDTVRMHQTKFLEPFIMRIVRILTLSKDGVTAGQKPPKYHVEFNPLWQMTDAEKADLEFKVCQKDEKYISMGVVTRKEIRESRFGSDKFSTETHIGDLNAIDNIPAPSGQSATQNPEQGDLGSPENQS